MWRESCVRRLCPALQCLLGRLGFDVEFTSKEIPNSVSVKDTEGGGGGMCIFAGIHVFKHVKACEFSNSGLLGVLFFLTFKILFQTLFPQVSLQCSGSLPFDSGV